jgi:hypothetical protein
MGQYLNSEYNDYVELYLIDRSLYVEDFMPWYYLPWMRKKRDKFAEEMKLKKEFTGKWHYKPGDEKRFHEWLKNEVYNQSSAS